MKVAAAAALLLAAGGAAQQTPADYEVTNLPGLDVDPGFKHYSGFMPIGDGHGTELFFWFVESAQAPATDPVVLWMNGGPGSSSVMYGFWSEHGPFRLTASASGPGGYKPTLYPYSWNQKANVLYVEAPSGVGFSFSTDETKYKNITDADSSHDNFLFLKAFFKTFSSFQKNDFYITAESYGGHYGPTLAEQLIDHPNDINMKGLLIGNPGINSDWYYNVNEYAFVTFMWSHALIPSDAYFACVDACGWNSFFSNCSRDFTHPSAECLAATNKAVNFVPSPLDPYDVLAPTCQEGFARDEKLGEEHVKRNAPFLVRLREKYNMNVTYNPCMNQWTPKYINDPAVLKAIHVDKHYTRQWPSDAPGWQYNEGPLGAKKDIALIFPKFFSQRPDWKIVVVSGTADSAVPFLGTERWMNCLKRPVKKDFTAWLLDGDVAGMVKSWDNIKLVTVKDCGHTIPTYCPKAGLAFFQNWMEGKY